MAGDRRGPPPGRLAPPVDDWDVPTQMDPPGHWTPVSQAGAHLAAFQRAVQDAVEAEQERILRRFREAIVADGNPPETARALERRFRAWCGIPAR